MTTPVERIRALKLTDEEREPFYPDSYEGFSDLLGLAMAQYTKLLTGLAEIGSEAYGIEQRLINAMREALGDEEKV